MSHETPYIAAQASPRTLEDLRRYVQQEYIRIQIAFQRTAHAETAAGFTYSADMPSLPGSPDQIVLRENVEPGQSIGWVYTTGGWREWGHINED